jgi:uncharacterized protein (DUF4415 family)
MKRPSNTNWEKLDQMTDQEIDTSDIPALDETFFKRATVRTPAGKAAVTVSVDADVLAWFRAQGPEYQKRMNAALRIYAEAHKEAA